MKANNCNLSLFKIELEIVEAEVVTRFDWGSGNRPTSPQTQQGGPNTHEAELAPDEAHHF